MKYWVEYIKAGYELVMEAEHITDIMLEQEVERHLVEMFAQSIDRTDIGDTPVGVELKRAVAYRDRNGILKIADECLLIHSYPLRKKRWPSETYYLDMGLIGYNYAEHEHMRERDNFVSASDILKFMFTRSLRPNPKNILIL